jgi:hypothetical protein
MYRPRSLRWGKARRNMLVLKGCVRRGKSVYITQAGAVDSFF